MPETYSFLMGVALLALLLWVKSNFRHKIFGQDYRPMIADIAAFLIVPVYSINAHLHHFEEDVRFQHNILIFVVIGIVSVLWYHSNFSQQKSELEQVDHLLAFSLKGYRGPHKAELEKKISSLPLDRVLKFHTDHRKPSHPFFDHISSMASERCLGWRAMQLPDRLEEPNHLTGHCVGYMGDDPMEWLTNKKASWFSYKAVFSMTLMMVLLLAFYMVIMMNSVPEMPVQPTSSQLQPTIGAKT